METPRAHESHEADSNTVEQLLAQTQEQVEAAYNQIPETPEVCQLDGTWWKCNGEARMELLAQSAQKVEVVRRLIDAMYEQNNLAEAGSAEQRATYKALQWLRMEYDIQSSELQATRARFAQDALQQKVANDNRAPEEIAV